MATPPLVGKDAQVEFNTLHETKKTTSTEDWKLDFDGEKLLDNEKWEGDLVIDGYPTLTEINLSKNLIDKLTIKNCPKLKKININDNKVVDVNLSEIGVDNTLEGLYANSNKLTDLNLKNCKKIKILRLGNNKSLENVKGLEDLAKLESITIGGTSLRLLHLNKLDGYIKAKEIIKKILGVAPGSKLPDSVRSGGNLDLDKLKKEIESKVSSSLKNGKETAERERNEANAKLQTQSDYDIIKTKLNQLKQNQEAIMNKLGLSKQSTQDQILTKIEELMNRPDSDKGDKVNQLERQLDEKNQQISKLESEKKQLISKENIVESVGDKSLYKLGFAIPTTQRIEISSAANTREAWKIRDQAIKEKFGELDQARKNAFHLNLALGTLLTLSLLGVGLLLLMRENNFLAKETESLNPPKKSTNPKIKDSSS